ncbi:MAG: hypothetical protein K2X90_04350 [Candidatus Babeliaceae bacterium]|nr:hypothetical protein [Candidatus Babeliaceae bacterium]
MKYSLIYLITFLIFTAHYNTLCMQKYPSESNIKHIGLDKEKSGSDSSVDSTGLDTDTFIKRVKEFNRFNIPENHETRDSLENLTAKEARHQSSKLEPIAEEDCKNGGKEINTPPALFQRRSKSVPCVPTIDTTLLAQGGDLQEKPGIHIVFQEFPEPHTPTGKTFQLFGLPLMLTHTNQSASIIFMPKGGAFTPTKNSIDFGDKTGDSTFDELKKNLPNDQSTALVLLTALLANRVKSYLASIKESAVTACNLEIIYELAKRYGQARITEIISSARKLNRYDSKICEEYDIELCRMQKPAEKILRKAGLQLLT